MPDDNHVNLPPAHLLEALRKPRLPKTAGVPLKLQTALDQLSTQPSTLSPELEAYLERTEGWMDRLAGAK
jgi:hypothetical protein